MAIGDNNYNGERKKLYEQTYYSRFKIKNTETKLVLNAQFSAGLLNLTIDEQQDGFKYETIQKVSLSPYKAKMFSYEIKKFREYLNGNVKENVAFGVPAGMGERVSYIGIHATKDKVPVITIGKFDNDGNIIDQASITFNSNYYFGLEWKDISENKVDKVYHNIVELDMFEQLINSFADSMNGAFAYSFADLTRYDNARILGKLDPIYDKLGIERRTYNNRGNGSNNFLNNTQSTTKSIDDILG